MPGTPLPVCRRPQLKQISTFADGEEKVIRDIEQLTSAVNALARCVSSVADLLDSLSAGSFNGGSGTSGGTSGSAGGSVGTTGSPGGTSGGSGQFGHFFVSRVSTGTSFTLAENFTGTAMVDATADISVTLPPPVAGIAITVMNVSAHTVTVKDNAGVTILPLVMAGGWMDMRAVEDSSNVPSWPTGGIVTYPNGTVHMTGNLVLTNVSAGLNIIASTGGHYFYIFPDNTGTLFQLDMGTGIPV